MRETTQKPIQHLTAAELVALLESQYKVLLLTDGRGGVEMMGWGKRPTEALVERFRQLESEIALILIDRAQGNV